MKTFLNVLSAVAILGAADSTAAAPPLEVFATGGIQAQGIVPNPAGGYVIVNTNGRILTVPATGGVATELARIPLPGQTCTPGSNPPTCVSLRDGTFLPAGFEKAGQFLVVGGRAATNTPAYASTVGAGFAVTPYASQPSSLWSASIPVTGFGRYNGGVMVVNQGSGQGLNNGGVDFFAPDGTVSLFVPLPDARVPYGATLSPEGEIGGTLFVSDAQSGRIYTINPSGKVRLFATVPDVTGLRQVAVAPPSWGRYARHLFVSGVANNVFVLDRKGQVVAKISGIAVPRALQFAEIDGKPSLLIAETSALNLLYRAGPEHLEPVQ